MMIIDLKKKGKSLLIFEVAISNNEPRLRKENKRWMGGF